MSVYWKTTHCVMTEKCVVKDVSCFCKKKTRTFFFKHQLARRRVKRDVKNCEMDFWKRAPDSTSNSRIFASFSLGETLVSSRDRKVGKGNLNLETIAQKRGCVRSRLRSSSRQVPSSCTTRVASALRGKHLTSSGPQMCR